MRLAEAVRSSPTLYLSKEEVEAFFRAIPRENTRDRLLFEVIYRYGLRRSEALLIRREHLSEGRIWITRLKGSISGEYPIHPRTQRLLWAYLNERGEDENPYLFTSRQSGLGPLSAATVYTLFQRYAAAAGIPRSRRHPHVLKHSIAAHLRRAGWDIHELQDWLGHASISSTERYDSVIGELRVRAFQRTLGSQEIANNAS